jgi:hypothetical protein
MTTPSEPADSLEPAELLIQIHPDLAPELDRTLLRELFDAIGHTEPSVLRCKVDEGAGSERYINLAFKTSDQARLWRVVEDRLYAHPLLGNWLRKSSMALCTGAEGWDDCLVLYHFNPEIELDAIDEP